MSISNCKSFKNKIQFREFISSILLVLFMLFANKCFSLKSPLRIVGGNDASTDEYSYVVRLEIQDTENFTNNTIIAKHYHLCTGAALSATWVLTAAHCLTEVQSPTQKIVVRYGDVRNSPWINHSFSDVLYTVKHPLHTIARYHNRVKENDIGLVCTAPMNISRYIKLSAADYLSLYGHEAVMAGFGITSVPVPGGKIQREDTLILKKPLQVLNVLICKCSNDEPFSPAFCLAPKCGNKAMNVCGGDSGGPLIHPSGLVGVLTTGFVSVECLDSTENGIVLVSGFVLPISSYIEWIYAYVSV